MARCDPGDFVAVSFTLGSALQIKQPSIPRRNLHGHVAETRCPPADRVECVERRLIPSKLRQKYPRPLNCLHLFPLSLAESIRDKNRPRSCTTFRPEIPTRKGGLRERTLDAQSLP